MAEHWTEIKVPTERSPLQAPAMVPGPREQQREERGACGWSWKEKDKATSLSGAGVKWLWTSTLGAVPNLSVSAPCCPKGRSEHGAHPQRTAGARSQEAPSQAQLALASCPEVKMGTSRGCGGGCAVPGLHTSYRVSTRGNRQHSRGLSALGDSTWVMSWLCPSPATHLGPITQLLCASVSPSIK